MLTFSQHEPGRYGAICGHWPDQRRVVIEKGQYDWRIEFMRHVPGKGFVTYNVESERTLKAAKARANEFVS